MAGTDYVTTNKANWDERAPQHARSKDYCVQRLIDEPDFLSDVVTFDIPLLGDITGLSVVHLQCHIATDSLSLARRGAKSVVGLDFSSASLKEARRLAASAEGGEKLSFVEASIYDATKVLPNASFDLVFTGIGALCWIPDIRKWAHTVAALLKPGGRLFIREGHPILFAVDDRIKTHIQVDLPYFEREKPMEFDDRGSYVTLESGKTGFDASKTIEWNHGIGEIVQSLISEGMKITGLVEHKSIPWAALDGQMVDIGHGEYELMGDTDRMPLTFTLHAVKEG